MTGVYTEVSISIGSLVKSEGQPVALKAMAGAKMPQRILVILFQTFVLSVIGYGFGNLTSVAQLNRLVEEFRFRHCGNGFRSLNMSMHRNR